nr:phosphotransferase [Streptomyces misionensis]
MSSPQGLIDLRITRTDDDFRREVYAHRHAIRHLSPSHGPRLLASEPRLRSLLTVQPRGWRVDTANLRLLPRVHEDAGHLLRVLHDSATRAEKARSQATRTTVLYVQRIRALVRQVGAAVPRTQSDAVERSAAVVLEHVRDLPAAFCHGTFGPAAWEWQSQAQVLSLAGFGRSQIMAAVIDLARPALLWAEQPNLRDWFFKGYCRALSESELLILGHMSVLAAGEDLVHAIHLRDTESIAAAAASLRQATDQAETARQHVDGPR